MKIVCEEIETAFQKGLKEFKCENCIFIFDQMVLYRESSTGGYDSYPISRKHANYEKPHRCLLYQNTTPFICLSKSHSVVVTVARRHKYKEIRLYQFDDPDQVYMIDLTTFRGSQYRKTGIRILLSVVPPPCNDLDSLKNWTFKSSLPSEYACPITGDIMHDPVVAADGVTYERTAIETWMVKGNLISPMTKQEFLPYQLPYSNMNLKKLIADWLEENGVEEETPKVQEARQERKRRRPLTRSCM